MSDDRLPSPTSRQRFIPGVYNYCDAWCERCRFQSRCIVFRDRLRADAAADAIQYTPGEDPEDSHEDEDDEDDVDTPPMTAAARAEWDAMLEEANRPPTPAQLAEFEREETRMNARLRQDDLVCAALEYGDIALGIAMGLDPQVEASADALVAAALEAISRFSLAISVKVRRAVRGLIHAEDDDLYLDDANGTAKLVRLMITESRGAWGVLMQPGRSMGDGVPARMIERLNTLDRWMALRFPGAMDFVRPGLDE